MHTSAAQPLSEKLGRLTKLAFGAGDLGAAIVAAINGFFLNAFLLDVAGLRPAVVGTIFLLVKIWDAVNDPLIGTLTDRTRSRWGRRRPWLLFAALPFGLVFFLQWLVPPLSDFGKFWYYLVVALLLDTAYTAINVPYAALTPELTHDYDERTSLSSYRMSFSILGGVFAAFLHTIIVRTSEAGRQHLHRLCGERGHLGRLHHRAQLDHLAFTRETHFQEERPEGPGFFRGAAHRLSQPRLCLVTVIYLLSWLSVQFVQTNLLALRQVLDRRGGQFGTLVLAVQVSAFLFLMLWARVSQRLGKQRTYYVGMAFWIVVEVALFFVQPGQVGLLFVLAVLAGRRGEHRLPHPLEHVARRDRAGRAADRPAPRGRLLRLFRLLQKLGMSLGLVISNFVLEASGYINQAPGGPVPVQPPAVLLAMRVFVSLAPALILAVSFFAVRAYPITREKHAQMRAELRRRQGSRAAQ